LLIWGLRAWNSCVNVKRRHYHFNPKGLKYAVRPWGNKTMRTINRSLTDVLQFWPGYWTAGVLSWMPKSTIRALFVGSKCKFLPCSKLITLAVSAGVNGTDYASYWLPCRRRCFYSCHSLVLLHRALLKDLKCKERQAKHNPFIRWRLILIRNWRCSYLVPVTLELSDALAEPVPKRNGSWIQDVKITFKFISSCY